MSSEVIEGDQGYSTLSSLSSSDLTSPNLTPSSSQLFSSSTDQLLNVDSLFLPDDQELSSPTLVVGALRRQVELQQATQPKDESISRPNSSLDVLMKHSQTDVDENDSDSDSETVAQPGFQQQLVIIPLLLSVICLGLTLIVDLMRSYGPLFPSLPVTFAAFLCLFISPPLAHHAGTLQYQSYHLWQPFKGGYTFVLLHSFAWMLYSVALLLAFICISTGVDRLKIDGVVGAVGVLGFSSTAILVKSLKFFEETPSRDSNLVTEKLPAKSFNFWSAEILLSMILSVGSFILFIIAETLRSYEVAVPIMYAAVGTLAFTAIYTHCYAARKLFKDYRIWQPFIGGTKFVLFQSFGWTTFAISICLFLVILSYDISALALDGFVLAVGGFGFAATILLILSLQYFEEKGVAEYYNSLENQEPNNLITKNLQGERLVTSILTISAFLMFVLVDSCRRYEDFPTLSISVVATFCMYMSAPITHCLGGRKLKGFRAWQPFRGGSHFVLLQAFGWALYSICLMLTLIYLVNRVTLAIDGMLSIIACAGCVSQFVISSSLGYFDPSARPPRSQTSESSNRRTGKFFDYNGETLVGLLVSVGAFLLFLLIDIMRTYQANFPYSSFIWVATALYFGATPVSHCLGGKKRWPQYSPWQPFVGGSKFVLLQAFGWTLFSSVLMLHLILASNDIARFRSGVFTAIGALGLVGHLVLLTSIEYFDPSTVDVVTYSTVNLKVNVEGWKNAKLPEEKLEEDLEALEVFLAQTDRRLVQQMLGGLIENLKRKIQEQKTFDGSKGIKKFPVDQTSFIEEKNLQHSENANMVSFLLAAGSLFLFIVVDILRTRQEIPAFGMTAFAVISTCVSPLISHCIAGPLKFKTYQLWQPFVGTLNFVLFQAFGWTLFGCGLFLSLILIHLGAENIEVDGLVSGVGFVSFSGQLLITISLRFFVDHPEEPSETSKTCFWMSK